MALVKILLRLSVARFGEAKDTGNRHVTRGSHSSPSLFSPKTRRHTSSFLAIRRTIVDHANTEVSNEKHLPRRGIDCPLSSNKQKDTSSSSSFIHIT